MSLGGSFDGAWVFLEASLGWFGSGMGSLGGALGRLWGTLDVLGSVLDRLRDPFWCQNARRSGKDVLG